MAQPVRLCLYREAKKTPVKKSENPRMPWVGTEMLTESSRVSKILHTYCNSDVDIGICGYMHCSAHSIEVVLAPTVDLMTLTE